MALTDQSPKKIFTKKKYFSFKSFADSHYVLASTTGEVAINSISPYGLEKQVTGQRSFIVYGSEIFRLYLYKSG